MAQQSLNRTDAASGKSAGSIKAITDRPVAITRLILVLFGPKRGQILHDGDELIEINRLRHVELKACAKGTGAVFAPGERG